MKFVNCKLNEIDKYIGKNGIVFFGCGSWLKSVEYTELMNLRDKFLYVIDNNPKGKVQLEDIELNVYYPEKIGDEKECDIIITSPVYMYDMYRQLVDMGLPDSVRCMSFPFMVLDASNEVDKELLAKVVNTNGTQQIPKIIHSFWFSGDKKTEVYQKCIDSWYKVLPDYKIIEWNMENYNWHKNPFVEKAIELQAWAFAADYARLDVLNEFGGIYMDMDVEVFKRFDGLLENEAVLSFSNHIQIDLAFIASKPNNHIIKELLELYNDIDIPNERSGFTKFFQPAYIRKCLVDKGIKMDGSLQKIDGATIFPNYFFMPQDFILFREFQKTKDTYCVHYDNFGWSLGDNKREKKIRDNNKLWKLVSEK